MMVFHVKTVSWESSALYGNIHREKRHEQFSESVEIHDWMTRAWEKCSFWSISNEHFKINCELFLLWWSNSKQTLNPLFSSILSAWQAVDQLRDDRSQDRWFQHHPALKVQCSNQTELQMPRISPSIWPESNRRQLLLNARTKIWCVYHSAIPITFGSRTRTYTFLRDYFWQ